MELIMQGLNIKTVAEACHGSLYGFEEGTEIKDFSGVTIDSRKIETGNLFIATKGERVDGHSFIAEAFRKGSYAVVCEQLPDTLDGPCILVEDSFVALKEIAGFYRSILDIKVVGITGSVGKTSTKEVVAAVLSEKYNVLKTAGNFNNEIGLPLTILSIREEHQVAVLEMGMNHFGEMRRLSKIAKPDICVITNIGPCHLEYLGSLDGVLKAKTEIFEHMNPDGICCLNGNDPKLIGIQEVYGKKPIFFGMGENCDITATEIENKGLFGSEAVLHIGDYKAKFNIMVPGEHMVQNALCAATVGNYLGLSIQQIVQGISKTEAVQGRSRMIRTNKLIVVDDCYNANPVSMKSAISLLDTADENSFEFEGKILPVRKVAILGDMFELGENEAELHGEVGRYLSSTNIDVVICIGKLAKNIYNEAKKGISVCYYFENKELFEKEIGNLIQTADVVLIKASNGMKFSTLVDLCWHHTWL